MFHVNLLSISIYFLAVEYVSGCQVSSQCEYKGPCQLVLTFISIVSDLQSVKQQTDAAVTVTFFGVRAAAFLTP